MTTSLKLGRCGRIRCPRVWELPVGYMDDLADWVLWFVWAGRGVLQLREGSVPLEPGVCVWMRPGGRYAARHDPARRLGVDYLHFTPGRDLAVPSEITHTSHPAFVDEVARRIMDLTRGTSASRPAVKLGTQLLRTLIDHLLWEEESSREKGAVSSTISREQQQVVLRMAAAMREEWSETSDVAEWARRAGYGPDHFGRLFRKVMGTTPKEYLIEHRIAEARRCLIDTPLTIEAVAEMLGYRNPYFFSRQFRQHTGWTPSEYRRAQAGLRSYPPAHFPTQSI